MDDKINKYAGYVNKEDYSEDIENEQDNDQEFLDDNALAEEFTKTQIGDTEEDYVLDEKDDSVEDEGEDDSNIKEVRRKSMFRSLAGVGLIYIAYSGLSEYFKGINDIPSYFLIFYTVFAVVGIAVFINSIINERKAKKRSEEDEE